MDKNSRTKILTPYIESLKRANEHVMKLKSDPSYVDHLTKIANAESEANRLCSELFDLFETLE